MSPSSSLAIKNCLRNSTPFLTQSFVAKRKNYVYDKETFAVNGRDEQMNEWKSITDTASQ